MTHDTRIKTEQNNEQRMNDNSTPIGFLERFELDLVSDDRFDPNAVMDVRLSLVTDEGNYVFLGTQGDLARLALQINELLAPELRREEQRRQRDALPQRTFRIFGYDAHKTTGELDDDTFWCDEQPDGSVDVIVVMPDDEQTQELLDWLTDAFCVEWQPVEDGGAQ